MENLEGGICKTLQEEGCKEDAGVVQESAGHLSMTLLQ